MINESSDCRMIDVSGVCGGVDIIDVFLINLVCFYNLIDVVYSIGSKFLEK